MKKACATCGNFVSERSMKGIFNKVCVNCWQQKEMFEMQKEAAAEKKHAAQLAAQRAAKLEEERQHAAKVATLKQGLKTSQFDGISSEAEDTSAYCVWFISQGKRKSDVAALVRKSTGLGLVAAIGLVRSAPSRVKTGLSQDAAIELGLQFEAIGAVVLLTQNDGPAAQVLNDCTQAVLIAIAQKSGVETNESMTKVEIIAAIEQGPSTAAVTIFNLTPKGCLLYVLWLPIAVPIGAVCAVVLSSFLVAIGLVGSVESDIGVLFLCIGIVVPALAPLVVARFKRKRKANIYDGEVLTPGRRAKNRTLVQPESDKVEKAMAEESSQMPAPSVPDSVAEHPAPVNEKECPMCAEDVKLRAKICRYCGHQFEVVS